MSPITALVLIATWILGIGTLAVYFEVQSVHSGIRVQKLLHEELRQADEARRWEIRYNERLSPDVLEASLPEEFHWFRYPIPRPEAADLALESASMNAGISSRGTVVD